MASNLRKVSGSVFMGNPIVFSVDAHSEPDTSDVTFHRIIMKVSFSSPAYSQELSMPVQSGQRNVKFDISSVFRAYAERNVYSPVLVTEHYPVYVATVEARDVWMKDGVLIDPAPASAGIVNATCTAIKGKYSDYERLMPNQTLSMSRKPLEGELVCVGDNVVYGQYQQDTGPMSVPVVIGADKVGSYHTINGSRVFVLPASAARNSLLFQFVNSRGVVESARARFLETEKMKSENAEFVVSRIETFTDFARVLSHKQANHLELTLCSGFVSKQWADWWVDEFCQSGQHWMLHEDIWIPCQVTIDGTFTIIDRTKSQMCYVSFTCRPNLNGILR